MSKWKEAYNDKVVNAIYLGVGQETITVKNTSEKPGGFALMFEYSYHGDSDEGWVVQLSQDGKEVRRFNTKFMTEIEWLI
jgi:hypothetical protein